MTKRLIFALLILVPMAAAGQSERPSWRSSEDTWERPEVPPEMDKPDFQFEVDRDALFSNPGIQAEEDESGQEVAATEPELGRVATWRERTFGGLREADPAPAESEPEPDPAPESESEPEPAPEPAARIAAVVEPGPESRDVVPAQPVQAPASPNDEFHLKPVEKVSPDYPRKAFLDGQEGWVDLEITVAPDGTVADVQIVDAEPRRVFERAAVRAALDWRFEAPESSGLSTNQSGVFRFEFKMDG
ncbi:MAG: energy transducer TonB [Xanthomonadales bacterium]|nr:energy transducer TonB [Xanthomonadales bacterium]